MVTLLLSLPAAGYGTEIDIPELGVRITNLPEGATKSKLVENLDASSISVQIRSVALYIQRLEDPVPTGATLTDASYRKALQENFGDDLGPKAHGQATSIAGHTAWTMFLAVQPIPAPIAEFTCVTYVIANEHAYRLKAHIMAPYDSHAGAKRPPDFDAALQAMSDMTFEPVARSVSLGSSAPLKLPRFIPSFGDFYPDAARARSEEGIVDVEFSIDGKGHARDVKQVYASSPRLGKEIPAFFKGAVFRVPANWEETGSQSSRFSMEFQFALDPPRGCGVSAEPRIPDATVVSVCGSRLPSAPLSR